MASKTGEPAYDEGFDDCSPLMRGMHQRRHQQHKQSAAAKGLHRPARKESEEDISLAESLALTLRTSVSPEACVHLAVRLLSHVSTDMLKIAMQQLDLLLRRDFIGMLPLEISTRILEYVPTTDLVRSISLVSRKWHAAAIQPCLWRRLFHSQGWGIDKERWALYCSLPCSVTPARALLDGSMLQVSKALVGSDPAVAEGSSRSPVLVPGSRSNMAANARQIMLAGENTSSSSSSLVQAALMFDTRSPMQQSVDSLSTVTAQAMALGLAWQSPRRPRRVLNTMGSPDHRTAVGRVSTSAPSEQFELSVDRDPADRDGKSMPPFEACATSGSATSNRFGYVFGAGKQRSYRQQQQQHRRQHSTGGEPFLSAASMPSSPYPFLTSPPLLKMPSPKQRPSYSPRVQWQTPLLVPRAGGIIDKQQAAGKARVAPINWRRMYSEYHQLLANWRDGRCRVDRWESAHAESIYCLQFDRDNRLFTGSRDCTVKVWHLSETGSQITPLATLKGHAGSVLTLQADGSTLVTGSSDGTVCVWDTNTYSVAHRLDHADAVLSLRFNSTWLATACKDRVVRVWRRGLDYSDTFELRGHGVAINAIHLHGDRLVSASGDRTIKVWDLTTRACVLTLADHTRGVACLDFDGTCIVSGSSDRTIRVWDAVTGVCRRVIHNAHTDLVRTVMLSRKMDIVVSGSYDESIKIWSLSTGALLHKIKNVHTSRVFKLMFDRSRIVSCSHDRSVSIIDFAADLPHARLLL
ncbi:hypothetical protein EV178_005281 [Coemansia sp. RSA 1646]|nr:hypothetical protein EV178_005281 [Coemansia sp. RSA 1646]